MLHERIASKRLIHLFRERTGDELVVVLRSRGLPGVSPRHDILGPPPDGLAKYGNFRIDVYRDHRDAIDQNASIDEIRPDHRGIYWIWLPAEHKGDTNEWAAVSVYGNFVLTWWHHQKVADSRWRRLDNVLSEIVRADG
jgi:hypothetical protein